MTNKQTALICAFLWMVAKALYYTHNPVDFNDVSLQDVLSQAKILQNWLDLYE